MNDRPSRRDDEAGPPARPSFRFTSLTPGEALSQLLASFKARSNSGPGSPLTPDPSS